MYKKRFTISIIKEARVDENRTPFTPSQIQTLIADFPNLDILVQPSKRFNAFWHFNRFVLR